MGYGRLPKGYGRRVAAGVAGFAAKRLSGFKLPRAAAKTAFRSKRSRTRTSTKRRKGGRGVVGPVAGHDSSSFSRKFRNKFVSRKCLVGGKQYYRFTNGQAIQSTAGRQGVTDFNTNNLGSGADLAVVWNAMATHTNNIVGGVNQTIAASNQGTAKIFVHSMTAQYIFTNTSNVGVWVNIYDCGTRKDGTAANTMEGSGPGVAMSLGLTEENYGGAAVQNTINNTPFMSHAFCTTYKVFAVKKIFINPGHIHKHYMNISINKWISADDITTVPIATGSGITANKNQFRDWTYWPLVCFYGSPVHSLAAPTTVSIPAVQLDVVISRQYQYQVYQTSITQYTIATDLATTIADPHTVPEDTGTDAAVVQN